MLLVILLVTQLVISFADTVVGHFSLSISSIQLDGSLLANDTVGLYVIHMVESLSALKCCGIVADFHALLCNTLL